MEYFDLGTYTRPVTTASAEAQTWFDRGLGWTYGYNHGEAVECFRKAIAADPACGMAYWGVAYAIGPNYNKPWDLFEPDERAAALQEAHAALAAAQAVDGLTPVETAMIDALAARYPSDPEIDDFGPWNDAFTDAMRPVHDAYPDDLDVISVFAEAGMNRTPWLLWDLVRRTPAEGASTVEARSALAAVRATVPPRTAPRRNPPDSVSTASLSRSASPIRPSSSAVRSRSRVPPSPNRRPCKRIVSRTVISGSTLASWNTIPTRRRSPGDTHSPSTRTSPIAGSSSPAASDISVLLPLPLGPSSPSTSPMPSRRFTPSTPRATDSSSARFPTG